MWFLLIWDFEYMVDLYIVFSVKKTLAKNPGLKPGQKSDQKYRQKSGHADHVLKTQLRLFALAYFSLYRPSPSQPMLLRQGFAR